VTRADEILDALNMQNVAEQQAVSAMMPETAEEIALLRLVEAEPRHIDAISRDSTLAPPVVSATLAMLELKGLVKQVGGMQYVLAR
jgi:DNA processing protein